MNAKAEDLYSEILGSAIERGYLTNMERHLLEVEIGPEAVKDAKNAVHRAKVIRNGGHVFNVDGE